MHLPTNLPITTMNVFEQLGIQHYKEQGYSFLKAQVTRPYHYQSDYIQSISDTLPDDCKEFLSARTNPVADPTPSRPSTADPTP